VAEQISLAFDLRCTLMAAPASQQQLLMKNERVRTSP